MKPEFTDHAKKLLTVGGAEELKGKSIVIVFEKIMPDDSISMTLECRDIENKALSRIPNIILKEGDILSVAEAENLFKFSFKVGS